MTSPRKDPYALRPHSSSVQRDECDGNSSQGGVQQVIQKLKSMNVSNYNSSDDHNRCKRGKVLQNQDQLAHQQPPLSARDPHRSAGTPSSARRPQRPWRLPPVGKKNKRQPHQSSFKGTQTSPIPQTQSEPLTTAGDRPGVYDEIVDNLEASELLHGQSSSKQVISPASSFDTKDGSIYDSISRTPSSEHIYSTPEPARPSTSDTNRSKSNPCKRPHSGEDTAKEETSQEQEKRYQNTTGMTSGSHPSSAGGRTKKEDSISKVVLEDTLQSIELRLNTLLDQNREDSNTDHLRTIFAKTHQIEEDMHNLKKGDHEFRKKLESDADEVLALVNSLIKKNNKKHAVCRGAVTVPSEKICDAKNRKNAGSVCRETENGGNDNSARSGGSDSARTGRSSDSARSGRCDEGKSIKICNPEKDVVVLSVVDDNNSRARSRSSRGSGETAPFSGNVNNVRQGTSREREALPSPTSRSNASSAEVSGPSQPAMTSQRRRGLNKIPFGHHGLRYINYYRTSKDKGSIPTDQNSGHYGYDSTPESAFEQFKTNVDTQIINRPTKVADGKSFKKRKTITRFCTIL